MLFEVNPKLGFVSLWLFLCFVCVGIIEVGNNLKYQ